MAAKLKPRIIEKQFFPAVVKNLSSLKAIDNIKCKLSPSQQERFKASCFGKLFDMPAICFSSPIVHHLLLRQADHPGEKELWFVIGGKSARFSQTEFALITGLNCGQYPSWTELDEVTENTRLKDEYFNGQQLVDAKCLEQQFLSCVDEDDTFKLALVYFLETVLLSRCCKTSIDLHWLSLVDDLEAFNKFPWGKLSYERTLLSLKKPVNAKIEWDLKKKYVEPKCKVFHYSVYGFPYAFQVWAYEAIPLLASRYATKNKKANGIPRILCWKHAQSPSYKQLLENIFSVKDLDVLKTLRASELESQQDYMTSIAEFTYALHEKREHTESEDGSDDDSDVNEAMQNGETQKSAISAETVRKKRERESACEAGVKKKKKKKMGKEKRNDVNLLATTGEKRGKRRKRRTKEFLVESSYTDPSKKQKAVTAETASILSPAHRTDREETDELLGWLKNYKKNRGRRQVRDRETLGTDNPSMGNNDHSNCNFAKVAQETEVHDILSTLTRSEGSISGQPSDVVAPNVGDGNILQTGPNQAAPDSENNDDSETLENPFPLHFFEILDALLQHQLNLDFCGEEPSQLPEGEGDQRATTID